MSIANKRASEVWEGKYSSASWASSAYSFQFDMIIAFLLDCAALQTVFSVLTINQMRVPFERTVPDQLNICGVLSRWKFNIE